MRLLFKGSQTMPDDESGLEYPSGDDLESRVAELDFGDSPPGMLVIREVMRSRVVGIVAALIVGLPLAWVAWTAAFRFNEVTPALFFAALATPPFAVSVWLFGQLLNHNCYFIAMDGQRYYRRWGSRKLVNLPLRELGPFVARRGAVFVEHLPTKKRLLVIKDAYAPERVSTLVTRCNAWRVAPAEHRVSLMRRVDVVDARDVRIAANREIVFALRLLSLFPLLIVLSVKFHMFGRTAIILWGLGAVMVFFGLVGAIVKRLTVRRTGAVTDHAPGTESEPDTQTMN